MPLDDDWVAWNVDPLKQFLFVRQFLKHSKFVVLIFVISSFLDVLKKSFNWDNICAEHVFCMKRLQGILFSASLFREFSRGIIVLGRPQTRRMWVQPYVILNIVPRKFPIIFTSPLALIVSCTFVLLVYPLFVFFVHNLVSNLFLSSFDLDYYHFSRFVFAWQL